MSIYNYTVLKSKPLKVCIPMNGAEWMVPVYRMKWHGKDYSLNSWDKIPFQQCGDYDYFDILKRRADYAWKGDSPSYIICTGADREGKIDWDDPAFSEGYDVFETSMIAFQEEQACQKLIGKVKRIGRGKYKFIPKVSEQVVDNICER